ncbi:hypothetical protein JANAI62_36890 [Jannaschia pagri]|uniref:Uncharacterized protein n=1 Tax=Jannaschia pagri TaxID=2829797 RepID=A0ABQ4NRT2_9RHOB|nr:hypothetical protein JANAI61_37260 [Jannaschia sp. AI_61]GIT97066.1 hypothetical protein JANAI62_36890 [Jannaschia sp. AI_62]
MHRLANAIIKEDVSMVIPWGIGFRRRGHVNAERNEDARGKRLRTRRHLGTSPSARQ